MILRLFCPICAHKVAKKLVERASVEVPSPMVRPTDDGCYTVRCELGHEALVYVSNLKFEILFDMGVHALYDGYPREAVSCFATTLERFYEFYWRVAMAHLKVPIAEIDESWRNVAKQSERQLGAYISACLLLTNQKATIPNPNTHVKFRNRVIHEGYIPTKEEAIEYGDFILGLVRNEISALRDGASEALIETYDRLSPPIRPDGEDKEDDDEIVGVVNILTAIDVKNPPNGDDIRFGGVDRQLARVPRDRELHGLELLPEDAMKKHRSEMQDKDST